MGKATIVEGGEGGLYVVRPAFSRTRIDAEIGSLNDELTDLEEWIARDQERLDYAELEVSEAKILADALIDILEEEGALPLVDLGNLIGLHNAQRSAQGLASLTVSAQLNSAAQDHADWLANNNTSGHTGAGGSTPQQRIRASGYPGSGGENVAVGVLPPESNAIAAWMRSPGHKANVLRESYRHIGVGYACRSDGTFRHFWVAVFGSSLDSVSSSAPASPDSCVDTQGDGPERIREAIKELAEKSKERDIIQLDVDMLKAGRVNKWLRRRELQAIPQDATQGAWCADYTENLTGEVATVEIPGEGTVNLLIRPGYSGGANYVASRDGQLFHRAGQTPAQAYFNAAILPGWQKHLPTYRAGAISNIDTSADTCTVTLEAALSSAQDLSVNQAEVLTGVPVEYMECNAEVFESGDRVMVQFIGQDWAAPKVIGFAEQPRPCDTANWPNAIFFDLTVIKDPFPAASPSFHEGFAEWLCEEDWAHRYGPGDFGPNTAIGTRKQRIVLSKMGYDYYLEPTTLTFPHTVYVTQESEGIGRNEEGLLYANKPTNCPEIIINTSHEHFALGGGFWVKKRYLRSYEQSVLLSYFGANHPFETCPPCVHGGGINQDCIEGSDTVTYIEWLTPGPVGVGAVWPGPAGWLFPDPTANEVDAVLNGPTWSDEVSLGDPEDPKSTASQAAVFAWLTAQSLPTSITVTGNNSSWPEFVGQTKTYVPDSFVYSTLTLGGTPSPSRVKYVQAP